MEQNNTANAKLRYTTPSDVISSVTEEIKKREILGLKKYGTTVDREDLTEEQWLQHAYEEALDLAVYLKKIIMLRKRAEQVNYLSPDEVENIDLSKSKISEKQTSQTLKVGDKVKVIACNHYQDKDFVGLTMQISEVDEDDTNMRYRIGDFWFRHEDLELTE